MAHDEPSAAEQDSAPSVTESCSPSSLLGPSPVIAPSSSFTPTLAPIPDAPVSGDGALAAPTAVPALPPIPQPRSRSNSVLQSTRPAPASPAPSRPPSQNLHRSPGRARAESEASTSSLHSPAASALANMRSASASRTRPRSSLGTAAVIAGQSSPSSHKARLVVRDYGFAQTDVRFGGLGPDRPFSNWGDASPPPPSAEPSKSDDAASGQPSWGGFGLFGLRGFLGRRRDTDRQDDDDDDDEYNNDGNDQYTLPVPDHNDDDYAFYSGSEADDGDLYGLYRAVYAFDAVGENEMSIGEGDYLHVRGRGVGEGWVVAVRVQGDGREGLVPEGYLEKVYEGKDTHQIVTSPQDMVSGQDKSDEAE